MVNAVIVLWYIVILITISIAFLANLFFIIILGKIAENKGFRKSLFIIFFISIIVQILAVIISIFALKNISITNNIWAIIPIGYFIEGVLYVISAKNFLKSVNELLEKDKRD